MANPGNPDPNDPRLTDPLDPTRPLGTADPMIDNKVPPRGGTGSTWLIALVVVVLAIIAYYVFARSGPPAPAEPPAATEQAPANESPAPAPTESQPATPPADSTAPANPPADSGTAEPATPAPAQ